MKYLILLPGIILYTLWSYHTLKHFLKGDYYYYPDTAIWAGLTLVGYVTIVLFTL